MAASFPSLGVPAYESSIFINCPFDPDYRPRLEMIVLAVVCAGFTPRSALENVTTSIPRMDRIREALRTSKHSIHDLSRCKGEGDLNLARFNMPLELGIAMGFAASKRNAKDAHAWYVLAPRAHPYARFISDLGGYDVALYDGTEEGILKELLVWFNTLAPFRHLLPSRVLAVQPYYQQSLDKLQDEWDSPPWHELVAAAQRATRRL